MTRGSAERRRVSETQLVSEQNAGSQIDSSGPVCCLSPNPAPSQRAEIRERLHKASWLVSPDHQLVEAGSTGIITTRLLDCRGDVAAFPFGQSNTAPSS